MDKTRLIVNMDNGKTLVFRSDDDVKYMDVVSGVMPMTMVVSITGGSREKIEVPLIIFQNADCYFPIRGLPDNLTGVCYLTSKKKFMTRDIWNQ